MDPSSGDAGGPDGGGAGETIGDSGIGDDGVDAAGDGGVGDAGCDACACALDGLLAYYPFDSDALDHSGHGHDLVVQALTPVPGKIRGALAFDGKSSTARVSGALSLSGARSFVAWIAPSSATGLGQPIVAGGISGAGDMFSVQSATPGGTCPGAAADHLFVDHWGSGCGVATTLTAKPGVWSLVAYVLDGAGNTTEYANGAVEAVTVRGYAYDLDTVTIGSNTIAGTTTQKSFTGAIDEVAIYDRVLTKPELDTLYASGGGCPSR